MVCKAIEEVQRLIAKLSFNPCYVGLWSVSLPLSILRANLSTCFNPCYVGLWSVSGNTRDASRRQAVSILVMLDYGL